MSIYNPFTAGPYDNPLAGFRSYTYNFAWVICSASSAMQKLTNNTSISAYSRDPSDKFKLIDDSYIVLFNSTTDAEYYIKFVNFTNHTIMGASAVQDGMGINSIGSEMSMQVVEPYTVDFIQHILDAAASLGVAPSGLQHMLKVWFTGYTVSNDSSGKNIAGDVQHITDVKPIPFILIDISMALTQGGAVYDITCGPVQGAGSEPAVTNVGGFSFATGATIANAVHDLNITLNKLSKQNPSSSNTNQFYTYTIVLDKAYQTGHYPMQNLDIDAMNSFRGDTAAAMKHVAGANKPNKTHTPANNGKNYQIVTEKSDTVNTIIEKILSACPEIIREAAGIIEGNKKVIYRHEIHNEFHNSDANNIGYVYYVLRKQASVEVIPTSQDATTDQVAPTADDNIADYLKLAIANGSYMELNYIYTGANTEITQFVMNIPALSVNAMSASKQIQPYTPSKQPAQVDNLHDILSQMNSSVFTNIATAIDNVTTGKTAPVFANGINNNYLAGKDVKKPTVVMPPPGVSKSNDAGAHTIDPSNYIQYRKNMVRYISKIVTTADVEIRGNPYLLNSLILPSGLLTTKTGEPDTADNIGPRMVAGRDANQALSGWTAFQPYIKINVRVPKKVDAQGIILSPGFDNKFSSKFWFDGVYQPIDIEHTFKDGVFTQRLHLVAHDTNATQATQETTVSGIPAGNGSLTDVSNTGKHSKAAKKIATDVPCSGDITDIAANKGSGPTQAQLDLVNKISAKYGVDPKLIIAIIYYESNFKSDARAKPTPANPHASAAGLMQLTKATQHQVGCSDPFNQADNVISGTGYLCQQLITYDGNLDYAVVAYNQGPGFCHEWLSNGGHFNALPADAKKYIKAITSAYGSHTTQVPKNISISTVRRSFVEGDKSTS